MMPAWVRAPFKAACYVADVFGYALLMHWRSEPFRIIRFQLLKREPLD